MSEGQGSAKRDITLISADATDERISQTNRMRVSMLLLYRQTISLRDES